MLSQNRNPNLKAYYVWGPFIRKDNEAAARSVSTRYMAPSAVHFWTPSRKLGQEVSTVLGLAANLLAWDVFLVYRKGAFWNKRIPVPAYWQHQLNIVQGERFNIATLEFHVVKALGSVKK